MLERQQTTSDVCRLGECVRAGKACSLHWEVWEAATPGVTQARWYQPTVRTPRRWQHKASYTASQAESTGQRAEALTGEALAAAQEADRAREQAARLLDSQRSSRAAALAAQLDR
jgi:hypothetical protein